MAKFRMHCSLPLQGCRLTDEVEVDETKYPTETAQHDEALMIALDWSAERLATWVERIADEKAGA